MATPHRSTKPKFTYSTHSLEPSAERKAVVRQAKQTGECPCGRSLKLTLTESIPKLGNGVGPLVVIIAHCPEVEIVDRFAVNRGGHFHQAMDDQEIQQSNIRGYHGIVMFGENHLLLQEEAYADETDGAAHYTAHALDRDGNKYTVRWETTTEWDAAMERLDEAFLADESAACDWTKYTVEPDNA